MKYKNCKVKFYYQDGSGHAEEIDVKYASIISDIINLVVRLQTYGTTVTSVDRREKIYDDTNRI